MASSEGIGLPLSWDGLVNIGINLIKSQHPDAELYEVNGRPLSPGGVSDEKGFVNNQIICQLSDNRTAIIKSKPDLWGEFNAVEVINKPYMEDVVIRWPVPLGIHEAFTILRNGGYEQPARVVTLRHPLSPEDNQPYYIFNLGAEFIAVGVQDRKIYDFGATRPELRKDVE